jgi:hypothetical protein
MSSDLAESIVSAHYMVPRYPTGRYRGHRNVAFREVSLYGGTVRSSEEGDGCVVVQSPGL